MNYINPPVVEAVCEFRLAPETPWDPTIPGLLYERVKDEFPNREQRLIQQLQVEQTPQGLQQKLTTTERAVLLSGDRKVFIQVGQHLLAINALKPYPTWSGFKPRVERVFRALIEVVAIQKIQRIGLRYINRIEVPARPVDLDEYLEFRLHLGSKLPQNMASLTLGCVLELSDGRDSCRIQLTDAVAEESTFYAFLLDLDYFTNQPELIRPQEALIWVDDAHQRLEEIFEGCLTDKTRTLFEGNR